MDELKGLGKDHVLNQAKKRPDKPTNRNKEVNPDKRRNKKLIKGKNKIMHNLNPDNKGGVTNV